MAFDEVDIAKSVAAANSAATKALSLAASATDVEQALIRAIQHRYPKQTSVSLDDLGRWTDDYAAAMRDVYNSFPNDLDVCALFAEALMNRTPWLLWDLKSGEPNEGADTLEIIAALEKAFEQDGANAHPGLLHLYIHALEMSPVQERALKAADHLRGLGPDAGHLQHMHRIRVLTLLDLGRQFLTGSFSIGPGVIPRGMWFLFTG